MDSSISLQKQKIGDMTKGALRKCILLTAANDKHDQRPLLSRLDDSIPAIGTVLKIQLVPILQISLLFPMSLPVTTPVLVLLETAIIWLRKNLALGSGWYPFLPMLRSNRIPNAKKIYAFIVKNAWSYVRRDALPKKEPVYIEWIRINVLPII